MSNQTKLKIGEFSQMMQVTVKTLRHYEQKGLLLPDERLINQKRHIGLGYTK